MLLLHFFILVASFSDVASRIDTDRLNVMDFIRTGLNQGRSKRVYDSSTKTKVSNTLFDRQDPNIEFEENAEEFLFTDDEMDEEELDVIEQNTGYFYTNYSSKFRIKRPPNRWTKASFDNFTRDGHVLCNLKPLLLIIFFIVNYLKLKIFFFSFLRQCHRK